MCYHTANDFVTKMRKRFSAPILLLLLFVGLFGSAALPVLSQTGTPFSINSSPLPAPTSPVMDYAGVLDDAAKQTLERKIIAFRDSTNPKVELAVAIVATTGDRDIFDYSLAVARGWKIGSKEQDNPGALLLIAVNDRKYYTQISRDLEDELPDGLAGQLQRQNLIPAFRQQNYGKGISDTIDAYIRTIRAKQSGEPAPAQSPETTVNNHKDSFLGSAGCLIILFVLMLIIFSRGGSGRGGRGGGGGLTSALPWILGSILANSGSSGGSSGGWGGSSGGGGSDWGGFGGGGDFGGGGAGGSW